MYSRLDSSTACLVASLRVMPRDLIASARGHLMLASGRDSPKLTVWRKVAFEFPPCSTKNDSSRYE
jgi:hypothetical protein